MALLLVAWLLPSVPATAADTDVEVRDNVYDPETVTVPAGSTVAWHQTGYQPHTVTAKDRSWDSHPDCGTSNYEACMYYDDRYERTFAEPGTYEYYCTIHGASMSGTVVVTAAVPTTPPPPPSPSPSPTAAPSTSPTAAPTTSPPQDPSPSPAPTSAPASTGEPSPTDPPTESSPTPTATATSDVPTEPTSEPMPSESDLPLGAPADSGPGAGRIVVIALVALVAIGLGAFGYWQVRAGTQTN